MSTGEVGPLPPGWDSKFDPRTGRYYFINHYTKSTSWEDPRVRYQQIGRSSSGVSAGPTTSSVTQSSSSVSAASTVPAPTVREATKTPVSSNAGEDRVSRVTSQPITSGINQPSVSSVVQNMSTENSTCLQSYPLGTIPPRSSSAVAPPPPPQGSKSASNKASSNLSETTSGDLTEFQLAVANNPNWLGQQQQDVSHRRITSSSPILGRGSLTNGSQLAGQLYGLNASQSGGAGTGVQASPLPLQRLQLEESLGGGGGGSPMSQRSSMRRESHVLADISEVDDNSEQALNTIGAMFPTVDETHIRDLLKKYHGSQAVVISALQVAKHPFITPGPSTVFTPPPTRHSTLPGVSQGVLAGISMTGSLPHYYNGTSVTPTIGGKELTSISSSGYPTPRPGSAASGFDTSFTMGSPQISGSQGQGLFRSFPRPHSSPKMKLRYLKSVFPTVEEYLLLDVLSNSDNNVQKAADRLVKMGYVKRDTPSAPRLHARRKEEERLAEKRTPLPKPPPIKSDKEKEELRRKMKDKYERKFDIPERILYMALESVLYDEEQALNLINSMIEDDLKRKKSKELEKAHEKEKKEKKKSPKPTRKNIDILERQAKHTSPKHEPKKSSHGKKGNRTGVSLSDAERTSRGTSTIDETDGEKQQLARGPNPSLRRGPNDDLLLTDYVTWNGPDPDLRKGTNKCSAKGPNASLRKGSFGLALGVNPALRNGPNGLLLKGSMLTQIGAEEINPRSS